MKELDQLIGAVARARGHFLASVDGLNPEQAAFKPEATRWSVQEVTEHIVRAEEAGIVGIWWALEGYLQEKPVWTGEPVNRGLSIEDVVARTWQPKEQVPEIAVPQWGRSLSYWIACLRSKQMVLEELGHALAGVPLELVIYPHPISGPLDVRQRLAFLRFHLDRHREQVEHLKREVGFPW